MISLFFNTRKRVGMLANLLNSIVNTTADLEQVEILITADNDDEQTVDLLQQYKSKGIFPNLHLTIGDKPSNLHTSINRMASNAKGDFLFVLNDDVILRTYGWDKIISESCDPSEIMYLSTMDTSIDKTKHGRYASFPVLTRAAYESLGYFMSERFVGHGGDVHLWRIFNELDRTKYIPVFLDHVLHSNSSGLESIQNEETASNLIEATFKTFVNCWDEDITEDVSKVEGNLSANTRD